MEKVAHVVIGAGVVGLAVARVLANQGHEVLIIEAESDFGSGISARNSEVIHAGLYYPSNSLKARLCITGRQQLYAYCVERGIAHQRCGKLIVASTPAQIAELQALQTKAARLGVRDLQWLDQSAAQTLEPALQCSAALLSPSTGIIDSHALMLSLLGDAENAGALLVLNSPVVGGRITPQGICLQIGGAEPSEILASKVFNCAGLGAQGIAQNLKGLAKPSIPPLYYAKGNYFSLRGRSPFSRLIYPLPEAHGLGVHLTIDLAGQARFGPDVEWVTRPDYRVSPQRGEAFYAAIRRYWPGLPDEALQPAYAGIRPKPHAPGAASCDFLVSGPAQHGVAGLLNLYGIESPGLTASLALADYAVAALADEGFP